LTGGLHAKNQCVETEGDKMCADAVVF